jgi:hypothetical protein
MNNKRTMLSRKFTLLSLFVLLLQIGSIATAMAQGVTFPMREMSNKLYGSSLASSGNILRVSNDQRSNMLGSPSTFGSTVKYKANYTIVKLSIDHAATTVPAASYIYKMAYKIEGCPSMTDSIYSFVANDTLVVAYNPDSLTAYQDMQIKVYPKLYQAKVTITAFYDITSGTPVSLSMPPTNKNFFVELTMQYQPFLKTQYLPGDMGLTASSSYDATKQILNVNWAPVTTPAFLGIVTPAQYELEWTYSDNYAADGTALAASAVNYNFKNNATRVITDSLTYGIPIVYPKGYIVYRVRMLRVDSVKYQYPIYGIWSLSNPSGTISSISSSQYYQIAAPHSGDSLNWNYTIHFAEGGKYKHVLGYFDGMLKNRQTITRFNSNPSQILATENIYDFEGRPEITTLPTVINTTNFRYQPGVSTSSVTGLPYSPYDFDLKPALCPDATVIPPFATTALANKYYSTLNTDTAGVQKYVPQAEGYPFVHTQLSTGFSDRVDKMGGAGTVLQVNKGHETTNEYLGADQPDLNNLFGINTGVSSFYTKTVSKDPNNQYSMLVKDYKGKQVLTSLIGASVDTSRIAIMFNDEVPLASMFKENKLATPGANVTVGSDKIYNGSFYMDFASLINVQYEYAFKPYTVCTSPYLGLSVQCNYDYSLHDACGVEKLHKYGVLGTTGVSTTATPPPAVSSDMVSLEKGKHTLDKKLTIADADVSAAVDSFFVHTPNCVKTENDFIREAVERTTYPCLAEDPCGALKKKMMEELFTNAKYGKWRPSSGGTNPVRGGSDDPNINSIYDIPQYIPGGATPKHRYKNDCVYTALNALTIVKGGVTYTNLGDMDVLTFKDIVYTGADQYTIAAALLPLHPEYCQLLACFDDTLETRLNAMPDAATAIKYNLFTLDSIVARDTELRAKMLVAPFNMAHISDSLKLMQKGTVRMDTFAAQLAFCLNDDAKVFGDAKDYFHNDIINLNFPNSLVRDNYFDKLRVMYLSNRKKYVTMAKTGAGHSCLPCDSTARMKLIPPPLVPVVYSPDGSFSTGSDGFLALFSDSSLSSITAFMSLGSATAAPADTAKIRILRDSATATVNRGDSILSHVAVDSIVARLSNCFSSTGSNVRLKDSLLAMVSRGEVHNGVFLPEQVRAAIIGAGLSLNDLCHPYLINYDYYDEGSGKGNCASATFYNATTDFFNTASINTAIKTSTTTFAASTPSWPGSNIFATKIAAAITGGSGSIQLGTQYNATDKVYLLSFFKTGSDTVKISLRSPKDLKIGTVTYPYFSLPGSGAIIFQNVACFYEDPTANAEGHIGRFLFRATIQRLDITGTDTLRTTGAFLGWNNAKVYMNDVAANELASSIPATQFKTQFIAFADSMVLYGGYAQDHPLFYLSMRNFMNYNLKKVYSQDQYNRFLKSCALADSMKIPMYGGYGRINFPATGYSSFDAFTAALSASDTIDLASIIDYQNGSTETTIIDYTSIPFKKIRLFNDKLTTAGGTLKATPSGVVGTLWLPSGTTTSGVTASTVFSLSSGTTVQVRMSPYLPDLTAYTQYNVLATAPTFSQLSAGSDKIAQNLYNLGVQGYWLPVNYATVNDDYYKTNKQQLLQYTYGMQALAPSKVLDTLQDYFVHSNISAFSGTSVSYANPTNPDRFTDLYYTDSLSRYPAYDTVKHVLAYANAVLGGSKIFIPTGSNKVTVMGGTGSGINLNMYRCGDGLYWYRYFGNGSQLFNVFIRVPLFVYGAQHPNLNIIGMIPATGDTDSRRFTVLLKLPGAADTIYADGSTDFNIAWTLKLKDVLLGNEKNYGGKSDAPASGEMGAVPNCEQNLLSNNIYEGKINYLNYITKYKSDLLAAFRAHVMSQIGEKLWIQYVDMRFGTTLYSYDRASNLIQTVPPEGVKKIDTTTAKMVDSLRANNIKISAAIPQHQRTTSYEYNTANKPVKENTPDAGIKTMYYDAKGNVLMSQSEKQRLYGNYTYFLYDGQNRLNETGEVQWGGGCPYFDPVPLYHYDSGSGTMVKNYAPSNCACQNLLDSTWEYCQPITANFYNDSAFNVQVRALPRTQVVATIYDSAFIDLSTKLGMSVQDNLHSRIAANMYYQSCPPGMPGLNYDHATHYSYDAEGNVKTLAQDFPQLDGMNQRYKRIDYEYDLLSGKIDMISYNRGYADQFFQRYSYDADNRLTKAETSRDGFIWKRDAEYTYYQHGPLARVSIGDQRVQGIDYAYTLQGWLKSINADLTDTLTDIGGDGKRSTIVPKDAYASTLDYFTGDYKPIGNTALSHLVVANKSLYNGNIARQSTDVAPFGGLTTAYTYDQMNRIRNANYAKTKKDSVLAFNNWYASSYKYDMDGNIKALVRKEGTGVTMDSMSYYYPDPTHNNKLANVMDYASFSTAGIEDIKTYTTGGVSRLLYDADGNVIKDLTSNTDTMLWNIYGKATTLTNKTKALSLYFGYDGLGHRTYKKQVTTTDTGSLENSTFYVREASGNILAEYNAMREYDKGGVIQTFPRIRGAITGTDVKRTWVSTLSTLGYLTDPAFATYITSVVGPTSSFPVGYYLANDPSLTQQFITGGFGVLRAMCDYSVSESAYPVADALRTELMQTNPMTTLMNMSNTIFTNPDIMMRQRALVQVAQDLPDLYSQIAQDNQITLTTTMDSTLLFNAMFNLTNSNPAYFGNQLFNYYNQNPASLDNWLNTVSTDTNYVTDPWYQQNGYVNLLQDALFQYGDIAANSNAILHGTDKSTEGLYGFADWWPSGSTVLSTIASGTTLATVSYYSDPVSYVSGLTDYAAMDTALSLVPSVDVVHIATLLGVGTAGLSAGGAPALKQQQISLGNHHMYGSSRIGIDNYWPTQYRSSWDFRSGVIDTLTLGLPTPWYSYSYNDIIDTGSTEPHFLPSLGAGGGYNSLVHATVAQHLLGQKQYELTNQLGNVQSTISDKRYVKTTSGGVRDYFNAAIVAAYDYYPYGMLMPGRFTNDTATHCVTTTVTQLVPVKTTTAVLSTATPVFGATLGSGGFGGGTTVYGATGGLNISIPVTSGVPIDVSATISYIYGSPVTIAVSEVRAGKAYMFSSRTVYTPMSMVFSSVVPTGSTITIQANIMSSYITAPPGGLFTMGYAGYEKVTYTPQNVLVTLCNKGKDPYEMGFNGQMKMNEVAGTGNWNTAQYWEYPTRTGTRPNRDPKPNPSVSPYATFSGNPIMFADPLGDTTVIHTAEGKLVGTINDNLKNEIHFVDIEPEKVGQASALIDKINKMSVGERNGAAKYTRSMLSFAFIGEKSMGSLRNIVKKSLKSNKEVGFYTSIGRDKQIMFNELAAPAGSSSNQNTFPMDAAVNAMPASWRSSVLGIGHTHVQDFESMAKINSQSSLMQIFGTPTDYLKFDKFTGNTYGKVPIDYVRPILGRDQPMFIATPIGITIYNHDALNETQQTRKYNDWFKK